MTGKNSFDWGWMILSDKGDGKSALSFINPAFRVTHNVESTIEGGLGTDPQGIYYYYVLGSISGSYVSGLPKVLINQGSGSVTLDGNSLQKDMWLADEFENRKEPDDLKIMDFAFKEEYYVICSEQGEVYIRAVGTDNKAIPYYGKYGAMPYEFEGGSRITCFAPFHNVTYWCADEERCILYDEQNARFIGIAHYSQWGAVYTPAIVYFKTYDQDLEVPSGVLRVNDMGAGTRCLAIGAYEKKDVASNGGLTFWSNYVSLIDVQGTGNYDLHEFAVKDMDNNSHLITGTDQYGFSGSSLLTPQSVIKMSSNFEKNPYFYFTDGDKNLYVYSMQMRNHVLAYTADSRITGISGSPIVCEFYGYDVNGGAILLDGHNIKDFNRRELRDVFGMVLQDTWLFKGTIMENIRYGRLDATDEEVIAAAKAAHAHRFISTLPGGYNMELNEEITNISQGQKQLLTIARAILADNPVLILDEATSSVDTRTEHRIQRAMDNLMKGRTSFVIAHRLSTIKNADIILVMKDGDIIEQGNHDELMAQNGFYADLYNSQWS